MQTTLHLIDHTFKESPDYSIWDTANVTQITEDRFEFLLIMRHAGSLSLTNSCDRSTLRLFLVNRFLYMLFFIFDAWTPNQATTNKD